MNARAARVVEHGKARAGRDTEAAGYLSLGSGSRADATDLTTDVTPPVMAQLRNRNGRLDHPISVGALGDLLHTAGLTTSVAGNEDGVLPFRSAELLLADFSGRIDRVATGSECVAPDPFAPYGLRSTDIPSLAPPADCELWVFGDLARLERYASVCMPVVVARDRAVALLSLDRMVGRLAANPASRWILLAPEPAASTPSFDRLAPMFMGGAGIPPGLLTSGATHRAGLVTNTDLLPTVAAWFGLRPPRGAVGSAMRAAPGNSDVAAWAALHRDWSRISEQQVYLGGLPLVQAALMVIGTAWAAWRLRRGNGTDSASEENGPGRRAAPTGCAPGASSAVGAGRRPGPSPQSPGAINIRIAAVAAAVVLALPVALLVLPALRPANVSIAAAMLSGTLLIVGLIASSVPVAALYWRALPGLLLTLILVDLMTGEHLLRSAWMGYSVMEGARYYGIGNEYAAAALAALLLVLPLAPPTMGTCALGLLAVAIGAPALGANAGGFIGVLAALVCVAAVWWRLSWRIIALLLAAAVLAVAGVVALDALRPAESQTHIARALSGGAVSIALRKAAMNGYLLTHSAWSLCLLCAVAGAALLWREPRSLLKQRVTADLRLRGCAWGTAGGALALFLFNDSGVVAAAEMLALAWAGGLCLTIEPCTGILRQE